MTVTIEPKSKEDSTNWPTKTVYDHLADRDIEHTYFIEVAQKLKTKRGLQKRIEERLFSWRDYSNEEMPASLFGSLAYALINGIIYDADWFAIREHLNHVENATGLDTFEETILNYLQKVSYETMFEEGPNGELLNAQRAFENNMVTWVNGGAIRHTRYSGELGILDSCMRNLLDQIWKHVDFEWLRLHLKEAY